MLVLIATNDLQGTTDGDYAWTVEGELRHAGRHRVRIGERCGCNRGFPGLASGYDHHGHGRRPAGCHRRRSS